MYEYTIQAFNSGDLGKVDVIQITVQARTDEEAIEKAKKLKERSDYSVIAIKDVGKEFKKG